MRVKVTIPGAAQLIREKGLSKDGHVQMFHTKNVLKRMQRYMPFLTGATYKAAVVQTDIRKPEIVVDVPYAKYLYYGKVMIDPQINAAGFLTSEGWRSRKGCIKVLTDRDLEYTKTKNPMAGPYWDRTLVSCEGKAMLNDLQRFIDSGR